MSIEWNLITLSGLAHGIVRKIDTKVWNRVVWVGGGGGRVCWGLGCGVWRVVGVSAVWVGGSRGEMECGCKGVGVVGSGG